MGIQFHMAINQRCLHSDAPELIILLCPTDRFSSSSSSVSLSLSLSIASVCVDNTQFANIIYLQSSTTAAPAQLISRCPGSRQPPTSVMYFSFSLITNGGHASSRDQLKLAAISSTLTSPCGGDKSKVIIQ